MGAPRSLQDEVARAFRRACRERDWEVAEFLLQALEAIAAREGDESVLDAALLESLHALARRELQQVRGPGRHRPAGGA